jgi:plasmid maintenance system antidote protein VapI
MYSSVELSNGNRGRPTRFPKAKTYSPLSDLLNGKAALTPEMALHIEKAFGPEMDHLLRMQLAYDIAQMRKYSDRIVVKKYNAA